MLKEPIKDILGAVNLKRLKEGPKKSIWTDWNKYPGISDADMVSVRARNGSRRLTPLAVFASH